MLASLVAIAVIASLAGILMRVEVANHGEVETARERVRSLFAAEAGISARMADLTAEANGGPAVDVVNAQTETLNGLEFETQLTPSLDTNGNLLAYTIASTGRAGTNERAVEAVVVPTGGGVFAHALFAGNSSGDPTYSLDFGGVGTQGDVINGDVFSGQDVGVYDDSSVNGTIRAGGDIYGASQPIPDIDGMNYTTNHDVDVLGNFLSGTASYQSDGAGGNAWQLPESDPAHIFRVNPSDRSSENSSTTKYDFYLEDPYEPVNSDSSSDGSNAYPITLSGQDGTPGPDGNGLVYYIDGNLWVHNKKTFSFKLTHAAGEDSRVTFVVRGNVYFSDNVFLQDPDTDGIAFIAIEDDDVADSGNIYFGDPEFGTLEYMNAFMYAENDFYDYNLDAAGSATVTLDGTMSAGNQVDIQRDYGSQHSRLTVNFDDRLVSGNLQLPGLPGQAVGSGGYDMVSWREIALN